MTTAQQIDLTSCKRILQYLQYDPAITGIVEILDRNLSLAYVGDMFMDENAIEQLKELFRSKKIITYSDKRFCRIHHNNCVDCLRLEPYILIKNLYKPYI